MGTGGDEVNLYSPSQALQAAVKFGVSPSAAPFTTFDNAAGLNIATITTFSAVGINGAFRAANDSNEIGSPGTIGASSTPTVTITAFDPDASELGDSGTFRISRTGSTVGSLTVNYTVSTGSGQAGGGDYSTDLAGVALIPSGSSFVDLFLVPIDDPVLEGVETVTLTLFDTGSYDVGAPASATIFLADHVIPPTPQAGIAVSRGAFFLDRRTGLFVQTRRFVEHHGESDSWAYLPRARQPEPQRNTSIGAENRKCRAAGKSLLPRGARGIIAGAGSLGRDRPKLCESHPRGHHLQHAGCLRRKHHALISKNSHEPQAPRRESPSQPVAVRCVSWSLTTDV